MSTEQNESVEIYLPNTPVFDTEDSLLRIRAFRYNKDSPGKKPLDRDNWIGYIIMQTVSGKGWIHYDRQQQVLEPGDVTCLDLSRHHGWGVYPGSNWEYYSIAFSGTNFEKIYKLLFNENFIIKPTKPDHIKYLFESILTLKKTKYLYFDIKGSIMVYHIISELLPDISEDNNNRTYISSIEKSINYIKDNVSENLDIPTISKVAGYSEYHFLRLFKKITGETPGESISRIRIERAKTLLMETDYPVELISRMVGFKSDNSFINSFKKNTSTTPGKFRKFPHV